MPLEIDDTLENGRPKVLKVNEVNVEKWMQSQLRHLYQQMHYFKEIQNSQWIRGVETE